MKPLFSISEWPTLACYDLEAEWWVNICLACHIDEYGNRISFPTVGEYLDWLFTKFPGNIVFAHAGGHYDHRFLIAEASDRGWDFKTAISGNSIVILTINNGKKIIKFGDSYRLMPDSLAKIGKTVGLPKLDVNPSEMHLLTEQETLDYCFRDCEIVLKGLQLMRASLTSVGADFAFTLASIATRYIRRMPHIIWEHFVVRGPNGKWIPHPKIAEWSDGCKAAYHGGRCEMFYEGTINGEIGWYDIVSSYPSSMREPLPLYYEGYRPPPKNLKNVEKFFAHCGITECTVYVPAECHKCGGDENGRLTCKACKGTGQAFLTVLPVKDPNGRLTFPTGLISGAWTNIELTEALKYGMQVIHINGQYRFEAVEFMRPFVDTFYKLRQTAKDNKDEFAAYAYKILLNSAYGKLVETIERRSYMTVGEINEAKDRGAKIEKTNTMGVYIAISEEVGPFRHTAAGAYVTAYSRLRLFRKAMEMYEKGAEIYYCDTDSLMLDMPIEETGKSLGNWEHVDTLTELELVLPKVYRAVSPTKTVYKCKGCPIERKWEDPDMPLKRWNAFKSFRFDESAEQERILGKDGVTGFISDIKHGSLHPRRLEASCKTCKRTGIYNGVECPACNGKGATPKPLVRALRSKDKKRTWDNHRSIPIHYSPKEALCDSASTS